MQRRDVSTKTSHDSRTQIIHCNPQNHGPFSPFTTTTMTFRSSVFLCVFVAASEAFSPVRTHHVAMMSKSCPFETSSSSLHLALSQVHQEQEDEAMYLMQKARECAFGETCSVEEARHYLNEVVHVQSGCAAGTLAGHQLCDEQDAVADIVAHLRAKVDQAQEAGARVWQIDSEAAVLYPEGGAVRSDDQALVMAGALMLIAGLLSYAGASSDEHVQFTLQEWWWATKDGYLNVMLHHYLQNGGL